jgi:HprK-related kinase B
MAGVDMGVVNGVALHFEDFALTIETEDQSIIGKLRRYFGDFASEPTSADRPYSLLRIIEEEPRKPEEDIVPWMEKGKEAFLDLPSGRFVRKLRAGISISIQEDLWSSVWTMRGPVSRNFGQVIGIIGAIHGLHVIDRGGSMIHASAVADDKDHALAVLGQSWSGRSSVAICLLEQGFDFISNDRIILDPPLATDAVVVHGLPKLPRVNSGMLLDGENTRIVLDPATRDPSGPRKELGKSKGKLDLQVERVLGRRWILKGELKAAVVLSWGSGETGLDLQKLTADQSLAELKRVSKDFGVFDVRLLSRSDAALAQTARRVPMYRVTGKPDPARLARELREGRVPEFV